MVRTIVNELGMLAVTAVIRCTFTNYTDDENVGSVEQCFS